MARASRPPAGSRPTSRPGRQTASPCPRTSTPRPPGDLLSAAHGEVFLPSGTKGVDPPFVIAHRANSARASLALLVNLPLRRFAPPPHEWGGTGEYNLRRYLP